MVKHAHNGNLSKHKLRIKTKEDRTGQGSNFVYSSSLEFLPVVWKGKDLGVWAKWIKIRCIPGIIFFFFFF